MEIKELTPDKNQMSLSEGGGLFTSREFLSCYGPRAVSLEVENGGKAEAHLSAYRYQRFGKEFFITPPFALHCGLEIPQKGSRVATLNTQVKRYTRSLAEYLNSAYKSAVIDLAFPYTCTDMQEFIWAGFSVMPTYTYRLNLTRSVEEIETGLSAERRKNIRDAGREGFEIRRNENPQDVFRLIESTLLAAGVNFDGDILKKIIENLGEWVFAVTVYKANEPLSTCLVACDESTAYYLAGGNNKHNGSYSSGALGLWTAILEAKNRGCEIFDFMGSSIPSVERFVRDFGGELTPFFRVQRRSRVVDFMRKAKQKLGR